MASAYIDQVLAADNSRAFLLALVEADKAMALDRVLLAATQARLNEAWDAVQVARDAVRRVHLQEREKWRNELCHD